MDDLADQIRSWADAAAPAGDARAVRADDVFAGRPLPTAGGADVRRRPRHLLAVAAVLVAVVGAVALALALTGGDNPDGLVANEPEEPADPTGEDPDPTEPPPIPTGEVAFRVLSTEPASIEEMGVLRAATNEGALIMLWSGAGPLPEVDFAEEVVVSITIPDDACPPTLDGFDRDGDVLTPRFVETAPGCDEPLIPKTFVAALDWATTGDSFRLHLPGQPTYEFDDAEITITRVHEGNVSVRLDLPTDTVEAGSTIDGHVVVDNRTGAPIEGVTCGSFFAVALSNDDVEQSMAWPGCAERFVLPEGESTHPVTIYGDHRACSGWADPVGPDTMPACLPDGSMPPLPPGDYHALIVQASPMVSVPAPSTITVTAP